MTHQKPPDGGWGWIIVLASFFIQFLCYGSPLSVGVLYVEWLDVFDEGKGKTAWVGSLAAGVGLLASPLCSASVSSFGARPVTIFSSFLVAGGLIISSFAPNVYFLYFSYGFMVGFGCGLLYTATVTITCQYFEKRRGLALGIVSTGSSVGTFVYACLQKELISIYGIDGCLLIIGALALNILACGIVMRPLPQLPEATEEKPCLQTVPDAYLIYHEKDKTQEENIGMLEKEKSNEANGNCCTQEEPPQSNNGIMVQFDTMKDKCKNKVKEKENCKQLVKNKCHSYLDYWEDTINLFKNKVFAALFINILLFDIGGFPPSLLMEDVAKSANIDKKDMIVPLVFILGIMMAVGKLVLGILADFKWINSLYLYVFTLIIAGLAVVAVPFAKTYATLAIISGTIGFFSGNWSIFPYVTTNTVGLDKLTHAYGILMFFAGAGNCLGPPIVGWFFDWTESYDIAFYFCGTCVILGALGMLLVALPFWKDCKTKKLEPSPKSYSYKVASAV
ncbi:monocarboxylate transporter 9 [Hyla sarda]|uniref:monocarboxylate transporter 9 n=1 Tax=Hyla sarda TaxID=327740 RepID=UPI0024C41C2D|nr:monocarboxylate transporter 9 [Hyla sarda]XP_056385874.1 monocarboxylate transporter 9 [Hyla sarda]XP_056385875.1 monocarboxylate transporter 9 [Hyla sarda]